MATLISPEAFRFADPRSLLDLATLLGRAKAIDDGEVRLTRRGNALAVTVPVLRPQALTGGTPTVLGQRTFALEPGVGDADLDRTVTLRAMTDRIARMRGHFAETGEAALFRVPPVEVPAAWAGRAVPRDGWREVAQLPADDVRALALAGIARVAEGTGTAVGHLAITRARRDVWGELVPIEDASGSRLTTLPAGMAFAAHALGFLAEAPVRVLARDEWLRLALRDGTVIARVPRGDERGSLRLSAP